MITTFYPPYNFGGDGIFVQRLARALVAQGHSVTVIHCVDAYRLGGGSEPPAPAASEDGIEVHALESGVGALSPLITHQLGITGFKHRAIQKILAENTFDVIHFHNTSLVGGPGILSYGDSAAIKLYTAHEYWLVCPLSTLWKYQSAPCTRQACVSCTAHARKPPQWWRYTPWLQHAVGHLDALISPSRFSINKHREMGLNTDFVHIPNFLPRADTATHAPVATPDPTSDRPFFLVVGRLEKSKGVQRAIEVFAEFHEADLLIVGSGPYASELATMADSHTHIRMPGAMSYDALVMLYRRAVAVIVPSIWYEPFGLIVIEAFAQQTPVIVNNAGALPELVADSDGGIVYNTTEELKRAVTRLLQSPDHRNTLGQNGYQAYLARWTEKQHLDQYLGLIDDIAIRRESAP